MTSTNDLIDRRPSDPDPADSPSAGASSPPGLPRLLCVDDEPNLLDGLRLTLGQSYQVSTAKSGAEALAILDDPNLPPFDAVVSDMRMPKMDGATFLTIVRQRYPDLPRLLLTGQADVDSAIAAVNEAKIFRFLTKPCPPEVLTEAIGEAIEQARLRNVERDMLDRTLNGTVDMMTGLLGLVNPEAAERTNRVRRYVHRLCRALERPIDWDLDLAAMLSQIGYMVLAADATEAADPDVHDLDDRRVELAAELLINIPRLETVAALIRGEVADRPARTDEDPDRWTSRELNAEILRLAIRFDDLVAHGSSPDEALESVMYDAEPPPAFFLGAIANLRSDDQDLTTVSVTCRQLVPGMVLTEDLKLVTGPVLAPAGMELAPALIGRIRSMAQTIGVEEPIHVVVSEADLPTIADQPETEPEPDTDELDP